MDKFEYAIIDAEKHYFYCNENSEIVYFKGLFSTNWDVIRNTVNFLDELGTKGWDLVGIREDKYYLKRRITDEMLKERIEKEGAERKAKEAEQKARKAKALEEARTAQMTDVEKAYYLVENTPELQHSTQVYSYIAKLKQEEMTFDEFNVKVDELLGK